MRHRLATIALRTSLVYSLVASVWILLSDRALGAVVADTHTLERLQTYKGWGFVAITTMLLYGVLRRDVRRWEKEVVERERAEAALRESQERLRIVTDTARVGLVIVDQQHRYRYTNRAYADMFHLPTADIVGQRVADVLAPVYDAQIRPRLERALGGERVIYELVVPPAAPDWQERSYAMNYEPGMYRSEAVVIVVVVEVTESKLAEEQVRYQADLLAQVSDAIISTDLNFAIKSWNAAAEALYGWPAQEAIGKPMHEIVPTDFLDSDGQQSRVDLLEHGRWQGEVVQQHRDGAARTILSSVGLLRDNAGAPVGVVAVNRDISARKQAEAELRLLSVELEQRVVERTAELTAANKELEAFSYSVSHDLRAPLRAIDGFSRILLEDYLASLPEEAQRYFHLVRSSAQQMGRLIEGLLAFSRLSRQPVSTQSVDPMALVRECLDELAAEQAGRRIDLSISALPVCQGDSVLLKQVWINLIANALKYTRRRDPAAISIGCRTEEGEPAYFVQDNGVGFDMRYSNKLFGVFQRMHRAEDYEGTGVGLAIAQRIIHRHGGRIWAQAAVDHGATFYFTVGENLP